MNSAEKTLRLLRILSQPPYVFGVTELGEMINCGKSGTFKLLSALVGEGFAAQTKEHKYTLGLSAYLLGKSYEQHIGVTAFARPYLVRLRDLTNENTSFSMMVNGVPTLICREESKQLVRVVGEEGQARPFYVGAISKLLCAYEDESMIRKKLMEEPLTAYTENTITSPEAILKEFAQIRKQGYACSNGELNIETFGVAAPITNASGETWAALSIGAPRSRVDEVKRERFIFMVCEMAREMSREFNQGIVSK